MHNVLIIGAGGVGRRHIKSYISTNRAIISIVEPDTEKCKAVEKDFQISQIYNSISEVNLSKIIVDAIMTNDDKFNETSKNIRINAINKFNNKNQLNYFKNLYFNYKNE